METLTFRRQLNGLTRVDMEEYFDDVELENLYQWIDRIPLTRPKKNIGKDFSDGVLLAEIVAHYFPKIVELHNYSPAAATKQKMENWYLLNRRVLRKLDLDLSDEVIRALANCKPKVVEKVLMLLRLQIDKNLQRQGRSRLEIDANFAQSMDTKETKKSQSAPAAENSQALVPVKTGRSSPGKLSSPRKLGKGEIPHNHPDRSIAEIKLESHLPRIYDFWGRPSIGVKTKGGSNDMGSYHFEGKGYFDPAIYIYPTSDNVPRSYLEEKEMECMAKDETIRMLNSKIRRLEHLLQLKDTRMLDLQGQIAREQGLYYVTSRKHVVK
ncbi:sperm flagellar protein 1-like isoform X4 [Crassostrea angulata]|uniref:sperm flagellar protein 1-like isoform X4 n=1 Tax=Magallana angulata TaxID=2784310 RepID=UPI0005C37BC6|nr:sperm flagellar protein 1 isoform X5 [Crassostrea gigas]XP_052707131.1 sperm flagellar protein 1-like isoform X4 [Crassostrea angulata]|eukprot:XP_011443098.1 PREDICTED: sperm flagellar protein 1 isoform X1 [Crassostrea gigas]